MQAIWERHKRFLLIVAGGLAVFLVASVWIQGYRARAAETERQNGREANDVLRILDQLDLTYDREMKASQFLEKQVEDLLDRVAIGRNARIRPTEGRDADPGIDFRRRLERVWNELERRAKRINISFPAPAEVDFRPSTDLDAQGWEDRYLLLDIVDRIFKASIDLEFHRIESVSPGSVVSVPIPAAPSQALLRYPVEVTLEGTFQSFLGLFQRFQRDHDYLGVELLELERDEDTAGVLTATIRFVGLDLGTARETRPPRRSTRGGFRGERR